MMSCHPAVKLGPVSSISSFYELSAPLIDGRVDQFKGFEGRLTLVVNIATADFNTRNELKQLNELLSTYSSKGLNIFAFPCNQFDGEPYENDEILPIMHYVRPGGRFEPRFKLFAKCDVNGIKAAPVFEYLRMKLPRPDNNDDVIIPREKPVPWTPVKRQDIGWNYEKFLINHDGQPVRRYTHKADIELLKKDIETFQRKIPRTVKEQHGLH
ncbi:glutathione peroxidase 2-like [Haliotis asinina]|uniref:glutathione peroxidase 2-like n=1 Tax=Haliotis asinina TaxID=109174 RepID=UPI00353231B3